MSPDARPRMSVSRWVLGGIGLAVSVAALVFLARTLDIDSVVGILGRVDLRLLLVALAFVAVELAVRAGRWAVLLPATRDGRRVGARRLIPSLLVGYLGNAVLPARLGEPIRAVVVSRRDGIGLPEALASVILERVIDVAALGAIAVAATLLADTEPWATQMALVAAAIAGVVLVLLAAVGVRPFVRIAASVSGADTSVMRRAVGYMERFGAIIGGRDRGPVMLAAVAYSAAAWLLDGLIFLALGRSLGIDLGYAEALVVSAVTVLSTAIPAAPGFVGTFELAGVAGAAAVGVPPTEGLALAVLAHVTTLGTLAAGGVLSLPLVGTDLRHTIRASRVARNETGREDAHGS